MSAAAGQKNGQFNQKKTLSGCIACFWIVGAVCSPELVEGFTAITR
jgi:hypothetical protein